MGSEMCIRDSTVNLSVSAGDIKVLNSTSSSVEIGTAVVSAAENSARNITTTFTLEETAIAEENE